MTKRTKKVGITGKYGPRYGVKIRKRIKSVSRHRARPQRCPECQHDSVKRISSGVWYCNHCGVKFAASAYSVRTRSYKREEAKTLEERFQMEDARDLNEEVAESGVPVEPEDVPAPETQQPADDIVEEETEVLPPEPDEMED